MSDSPREEVGTKNKSHASATVAPEARRAGSSAANDGPLSGRAGWRRFRQHKPAWISFWFLLVFLVFILGWPLLSSSGVDAGSDDQFQPPSLHHWCGTDVHGRDLLTRLAYGARVSLAVGLVGALLSLLIGVFWGGLAGYLGGRWDNLMMRLVDILYSIPSIIFVLVFITSMEIAFKGWLSQAAGTGLATLARVAFLVAGLGLVSWLTMARIVRGQVLSVRTRGFVEASRALGATHARILRRHILPNVYGVIIVYLTLTIPGVILYESFLSFLGLGIQPPLASWGSLIADGAQQLNPIRIYWWMIAFPAAMLVSTLLALNFLGDGLRDALDPRARIGSPRSC
jgi:oligopeptide transport system permease protein